MSESPKASALMLAEELSFKRRSDENNTITQNQAVEKITKY